MESYTPTRLDFRCSLVNLIIHYFTWLQYFIPLSSFRAYRLGQGDKSIQVASTGLAELWGGWPIELGIPTLGIPSPPYAPNP
jgi:hypothetical protein